MPLPMVATATEANAAKNITPHNIKAIVFCIFHTPRYFWFSVL
jgi:hypothetical protein